MMDRALGRRTMLAPLVLAPLVLASVALPLAGCSASEEPVEGPPVAGEPPSGGRLLRDMGVQHGPPGFALPTDVQPHTTTDSPNVVTFTFEVADGEPIQDFLTRHATHMGLTDIRSTTGSMTFRTGSWDGGFTTSDRLVGLTLRKVR